MSCIYEPSAKTTKHSDKHCYSFLPTAFPTKHSLCDSAGRLRACFWEGRMSTRAAVHIWFGLAPSAPTANPTEVAALQHSSRPRACTGSSRGINQRDCTAISLSAALCVTSGVGLPRTTITLQCLLRDSHTHATYTQPFQ